MVEGGGVRWGGGDRWGGWAWGCLWACEGDGDVGGSDGKVDAQGEGDGEGQLIGLWFGECGGVVWSVSPFLVFVGRPRGRGGVGDLRTSAINLTRGAKVGPQRSDPA